MIPHAGLEGNVAKSREGQTPQRLGVAGGVARARPREIVNVRAEFAPGLRVRAHAGELGEADGAVSDSVR